LRSADSVLIFGVSEAVASHTRRAVLRYGQAGKDWRSGALFGTRAGVAGGAATASSPIACHSIRRWLA